MSACCKIATSPKCEIIYYAVDFIIKYDQTIFNASNCKQQGQSASPMLLFGAEPRAVEESAAHPRRRLQTRNIRLHVILLALTCLAAFPHARCETARPASAGGYAPRSYGGDGGHGYNPRRRCRSQFELLCALSRVSLVIAKSIARSF